MFNEMIYSFSRLESFRSCQYAFYLTYIKKVEGFNNVYGILGGAIHEILEELQIGKITKEKALEIFHERLNDCDILGFEFMNDNVRRKYIENIENYIENFTPIICKEYGIEEEFLIEIEGIKVKGFIDFYYINDKGRVVVIDYKSSSKFSNKDLPEKTRQLILYGIALEKKGYKVEKVGFDMLKYYSKPYRGRTVLKERCEVPMNEYQYLSEKGFVFNEFTEENKNEVISYIKDTVNQLKKMNVEKEEEWQPIQDYKENFFCKTLCGHYDICKYQNEV